MGAYIGPVWKKMFFSISLFPFPFFRLFFDKYVVPTLLLMNAPPPLCRPRFLGRFFEPIFFVAAKCLHFTSLVSLYMICTASLLTQVASPQSILLLLFDCELWRERRRRRRRRRKRRRWRRRCCCVVRTELILEWEKAKYGQPPSLLCVWAVGGWRLLGDLRTGTAEHRDT